MTLTLNVRTLMIVVLSIFSSALFAQTNIFWNVNGNASSSGSWLGTSNNEPLIFKTNSLEALRIKPNGEIKIAAFENIGKGIVTFNNNGVLTTRVFPNDTNQIFCGSGNFKSIATLSGWTRTGSVLYNSPGVNVGIGVNNPLYPLHVIGDAFFTGVVNAQGVILTNKLMADTMNAGYMFALNDELYMRAGGVNEIYTTTGSLRFNSNIGNDNHVVFSAGTNGNVGIGTFNPAYKLDVAGKAHFSDDVFVHRLRPLPGDTVVIIGDSSIYISGNNIYTTPISTPQGNIRGLGLGSATAQAYGPNSVVIGQKARVDYNVNNAIVIGTGVTSASGVMVNSVPYSLMIGFNSDIPTMFVAAANGAGTIGKVGLGTTAPASILQVNDNTSRVTIDKAGFNNEGLMGFVGFNAHSDPSNGWFTFQGDGSANNSGALITWDNNSALHFYLAPRTSGSDQLVDPTSINNFSIVTMYHDRVQIGPGMINTSSVFYPGTRLSVDGRIMCKDLVVSLVDWQDEVFDSAYALMPIDSVHAYIQRYGHLPDVKPEAEIESDGMSVTETITIQQRKLEEMMLYIIELNERLKLLEAENAELKEEKEDVKKESEQENK